MDTELAIILIGGGIIVIMLAIFIPLIVKDFKKNKDKYIVDPEKIRAEEDERLNAEAETVILPRAEVIDLICGVHTEGRHAYRLTETVKEFYVKFRDESGKIYDLRVCEEDYCCFEIGMVGELTLVDGKLYSFNSNNDN